MESAIWGLVGALIGAAVSIGTTWLSILSASKLQKEASSLERTERAREFQRKTLLELQEALSDSLRMAARAHDEDESSYRACGQWGISLLSEEVNKGIGLANKKTSMLIERVANDALRATVKDTLFLSIQMFQSKTRDEAERISNNLPLVASTTMERIGTILRSMY